MRDLTKEYTKTYAKEPVCKQTHVGEKVERPLAGLLECTSPSCDKLFSRTPSPSGQERKLLAHKRMIDELTNEPRPHPRTPDPYVDIFGSYDEYMDHVGIGPECWY